MKIAIAFLVLFAASTYALTSEAQLQTLFTNWMIQNNKVYSAQEFQNRYAIWKENFKFVQEFNTRGATFTVAMNKFADLSNKEFVAIYNGLKMEEVPLEFSPDANILPDPSLPDSVDWRTKGVLTGVKNQGQCGSCWSFSATGSLEGAHALHTGELVGLSEQNLVDCSTSQGNNGCNGGLMDYAFQYVISNNGIDTESSYPYTAQDGTCRYNPANCGSTLKSYSDVTPRQSELALQTASANIGPVSVAIDASHSSFQLYSGGVYYEPACSSTQLDHGVLCVGYGSSSGQDYWIVKNSWGTNWGMNGYIWMARNRANNCGIATMASYPIASGAGKC